MKTSRRDRVGPNHASIRRLGRKFHLGQFKSLRSQQSGSAFCDFERGGGLLAYGVDIPESYRRAAAMIVKVLHDAKPEDLPIERPVKFQLVVNLKTAKMLGIAMPTSLLLRADEVIE
jgi:putative ABC transport system substrate-binding protein